jgi:hypothetical protein
LKGAVVAEKDKSGLRRKDYVAHIAVGLFVLVAVLELLLVAWLPRKMITEKIFEHEVALQQLVALEDVLRRQLRRSMKFQNDWQEGEVGMALDCLDEIAKYLRENQNNMTRDEIKDLYDVLLRFERRYNRWDEGKYCVSFEKIDIEPLLKKSLDDYNERHKKE